MMWHIFWIPILPLLPLYVFLLLIIYGAIKHALFSKIKKNSAESPYQGVLSKTLASQPKDLEHKKTSETQSLPTFWFVIPAHNEEESIAATIQSCKACVYPATHKQIVVIADNCTDQTAEIARNNGAYVWERSHPTRKSKGYALEDFFEKALHQQFEDALKTLELPDAFVIIDADTLVAPNLLEAFAYELCKHPDKPWIQCYYTVRNPHASWRTELLTFALSLFNGIWLMGESGLGLGSSLRGNGMCCPISSLKRMPWKAATLAEDLEFAWRLRLNGLLPHFTSLTYVAGEMVSHNTKAAASQRLRWENGRRLLRQEFAGKIWKSSNVSIVKKILWFLDLYFPPLSRLVALTLGLAAASALGYGVACYAFPEYAASFRFPTPYPWFWVMLPYMIYGSILAVYLMLPLILLRLSPRYYIKLVYAPLYMLWKATLLFAQKPQTWVRTAREQAKGETKL